MARRMMLPLLDMLNHGDGSAANVEIMQADNGDLYAYTLREIPKGEEVCLLQEPCLQPGTAPHVKVGNSMQCVG